MNTRKITGIIIHWAATPNARWHDVLTLTNGTSHAVSSAWKNSARNSIRAFLQTQEEFELRSVDFLKGFNPYAKSANQMAIEMQQMAADVEAAAASLNSAKWVAEPYTEGEVRWSPRNFLNYRRRVPATVQLIRGLIRLAGRC